MRFYEIKYKVNGKECTAVEQSATESGKIERKEQFLQRVLNRIESLVSAGAVITDLAEYKGGAK